MSYDLVIFSISLFAFIVSMIGTLGSFFAKKWKWFTVTLLCVLLSCACALVELYQMIVPEPEREMPVMVRSPLNPL